MLILTRHITQRKKAQRFLSLACITLLLCTLASCGFHLRGSSKLNASLPELSIESNTPRAPIVLTLKQWLRSAGVSLTDSSDITLSITNLEINKRPIAYDSRGKIAQYELTKSLTIGVINKNGKVLLSPTPINARQPYRYNESDTSAKDEEQALLEREMDAAIANQVIRQLEQIQ